MLLDIFIESNMAHFLQPSSHGLLVDKRMDGLEWDLQILNSTDHGRKL